MIKDITLGQYFPINSPIHRLDPRTKLLSLILFIVLIFFASGIYSVAFVTIAILTVLIFTGVPIKMYLKNLKGILPIIILTAVLNIFYITEGNVLLSFWIIKVTDGGIMRALLMALRIVLLILVSAALTYTTTPTSLTDGIESLLSFLKYVGLKSAVHTIAMMMTIALRFIPTLVDETDKLMSAQKARGADFESGNIIKRVKALVPILVPLLISSVRRAFELSEAMESRCYTGLGNRTRMKQLKFSSYDIVFSIILAGITVVTVVAEYFC